MNLFHRFFERVADKFWVLPGLITATGIVAAELLVELDRSGRLPRGWIENAWVYSGGATGARTLLGAVASSTIGVAGTVFSITIAALSLAAGQMGPRLLRNFTHDRGNQVTLGVFLGTFSYALMVLRSVRTAAEGEFIPHLSLSVGILLAFLSVATLVYFVGHMAGRINVDTVIELVSRDVHAAIDRIALDEAPPPLPADRHWAAGRLIADERRGYLQAIDHERLLAWAVERATSIRLFVRPGDYVFPGTSFAVVMPPCDGIEDAIVRHTSLGPARVSAADLEFPVRQLVEVAVRALSPGINDPHTAMSALERLGAALCDLAWKHLPSGVLRGDAGRLLVVPAVDYDGLCDAMFHMIRQNAAGSAAVSMRMLEVMTAVADRERDPKRLAALGRHADLVLADAARVIETHADLDDVRKRHEAFNDMRLSGPASRLAGSRLSSSSWCR